VLKLTAKASRVDPGTFGSSVLTDAPVTYRNVSARDCAQTGSARSETARAANPTNVRPQIRTHIVLSFEFNQETRPEIAGLPFIPIVHLSKLCAKRHCFAPGSAPASQIRQDRNFGAV
jgi:hypothetical protein